MKPLPAILREPDQRYWRRRANRRVRKARLTRSFLRVSVLLLINFTIAGVLFYSGARTLTRLRQSAEFSLHSVELQGTRRASAEQIHGRLQAYLGRNLFDLVLHDVERLTLQDPWVAGATVKRILPDTLRVVVRERTPGALAVIHGVVHLVDSTGYVIGPSGAGLQDDLPVLTGLAGLEPRVLAVSLRNGVRILERLKAVSPEFFSQISELNLATADRVELRTSGPGPRIILDRTSVERNLAAYLERVEEIRRHAGPVEYVDLRWRNRITVKPLVHL